MILNDVRKNKQKTGFIVILFFLFITLVVYFTTFWLSEGSYIAVPIALMFAIGTSFFSYYNSDKIILKLNGARPANEQQDQQLKILLEGLCIATGLPMPKLYVIEDTALNAFATGRNPENAVICVTTGLITRMNKYELEAVLAHELSHIRNYDILLQTIVTVMVGFVVILADFVTRWTIYGNHSDDNKNPLILIVGLVFLILSPIFATLIHLAISRNREYLADASAAEITRNPEAMINALKNLTQDQEALEVANKSSAMLYIVTPFKGKKKSSLWSTHPSLEDRVKRLENIR